jgi:hypothetical protein
MIPPRLGAFIENDAVNSGEDDHDMIWRREPRCPPDTGQRQG